jgi:hypothetical protein
VLNNSIKFWKILNNSLLWVIIFKISFRDTSLIKITFKVYFLLRSGTQGKEKLKREYIRKNYFFNGTKENAIFLGAQKGFALIFSRCWSLWSTNKSQRILRQAKTEACCHLECTSPEITCSTFRSQSHETIKGKAKCCNGFVNGMRTLNTSMHLFGMSYWGSQLAPDDAKCCYL